MRGITFPISWVMGSWVCHLRDVLQLCAGLAWRNFRFDNSYCNKIQSPHRQPPFLSTSQVLLLLGCQYGNPSRKVGGICLFYFFFFFFSVSVKVLPVTRLLSGICSYFLRIERVVEMRRFLWWTQ